MKRTRTLKHGVLAALAAGVLCSMPAFADKPDWAGGGRGHGDDRAERREDRRDDRRDYRDDRRDDRRHERREVRRHDDHRPAPVSVDIHFHDRQRTVIREYYHREFSGGRCPPGLARKHDGCMPPGIARAWSRGRPLPRHVVYYDLPPALVVEIGAPPPGYKFVRVAGDILMIAIGTGLVVDALEDLSHM